jgi:hypothetical protein
VRLSDDYRHRPYRRWDGIVTLKGNDTTYDQGDIQCEANCTNQDAVYFDAWKFINRPPDVNGDGNNARDPGDDGLYEDVNGDGDTNVGDAQTLFESKDAGPVQDHLKLFDFNNDQSLNVGDAQALFNEVTRS